MGWERASAGVYVYKDSRGRVIERRNTGTKPKATDIPGAAKPAPKPQTQPPVVVAPPVVVPPVVYPTPSNSSLNFDYGLDVLGAAKYSTTVVHQFPSGWWIGVFSSTFGDARPVVEQLLASGRLKGVRVQLLWSDNHQFPANVAQLAAAEARKWKQLVDKYPVRWAFSGCCEHLFTNNVAESVKRAVQEVLPGTIYVNSFMKGGSAIDSSQFVWNEVHGSAAPLSGFFSFSFDGTECVNFNMVQRKADMAGAQVFFFWTHNFNGKKSEKDKTPRPRRKAWPTVNMLDSIIYLSRDKGITGMQKSSIWKSHSEQYDDVPSELKRDNKPVLIIPSQALSVQLMASNGQVVASAKRFGSFSGGGSRYYFSDWGHILAEKAKRIQGSPVVDVVAGGQHFGRINPAFRDGEYRS